MHRCIHYSIWIRRLLLISCTLIASQLLYSADKGDTKEYVLGIFPYMAPRQTIEFYGPIAAAMEKAIAHPVKLQSQPSFTDFSQALANKSYDIALIQPFDYPEVVEKNGYIPIAQMAVPLVTQLFVRSDSKYQNIRDLIGTTIAMPPAKAANSRMAIRALFDNQLIPGKDVTIRYFNSHDSCIQQVWINNASACGTAQPPITVFEKRMKASLRPIHSTPALPHIIFVASPRLSDAERTKLQELIIGWKDTENGRAILKSLGFAGFMKPRPNEYANLHNYDPEYPQSEGTLLSNSEDFVFGVVPFLAPQQLVKNIAPLLPALSKAVGIPVRMRTSVNFGRFMDDVSSGKFDLILLNPFDYEKASHAGYIPVAGMKDHIQSSFFVKKSSELNQIADLKGKVVAMPPQESAVSRMGRHALLQAGLNPDKDTKISYHKNHDACLNEVKRGTASACVTSEIVVKMLPSKLSGEFRKFGESISVPGVIFMAHKRIPEKVRNKIQSEMLSWKNTETGREINKSLNFGEFVKVNPAEYQALKNFEIKP